MHSCLQCGKIAGLGITVPDPTGLVPPSATPSSSLSPTSLANEIAPVTPTPAPTGMSTGEKVAIGVGVVAVLGLGGWGIYHVMQTHKKEGGARRNPLPPSRRMSTGYAYHLVRGEWDIEVISSDVADRARMIGYKEIDGHRMALFKLGRSYYAQLPQNLRPAS